MNYSLTITPQTYLHCGSGEGGVLVDSDVVFHSSGFPMIPARRLKGLLRESMTEVLEIMGAEDNIIANKINEWFGKGGDDYANGIIKYVGSGYVAPWHEIKEALNRGDNPGKDSVIAYTTTEVQQTALDKEGVAKARSLRNYRVVNPRQNEGFKFEAVIETSETLSDEEEKLLNRAVQNLRYIGSRRNRGMGEVKCSLSLVKNQTNLSNPEAIKAGGHGLKITLKTLSPVIISKQDGDLSTLQTNDVITGAQLRGALARWFMKKNNLTKANAHTHEVFYTLFLSGKVNYGHLYFDNTKPIPAFIHKPKYEKNPRPINIFDKNDGITKAESGVGLWKVESNTLVVEKKSVPKKQANFHNSRQNRTAGRNTGGELFYYEALEEDQTFEGTISGTSEALQVFANAFLPKFKIHLGRSKSAQYGEAEVIVSPFDLSRKNGTGLKNDYLVVAESSIVLVNDCNFPALELKWLVKELQKAIDKTVSVAKVAAGTTTVESYNAVWQAKSGKFPAYAPGSSFRINTGDTTEMPAEIQVGKFVELGYGKCQIIPYVNDIRLIDLVNKKEANGTTGTSNTAPLILQEIEKHKRERQIEESLESKAIESAKRKADKLNNHQCGRIEQVFVHAEASSRRVLDFLNDVKGKPIGESLSKANILLSRDKDVNINIPGINNEEQPLWKYQRHYWLAFFRSLRKFNKQ